MEATTGVSALQSEEDAGPGTAGPSSTVFADQSASGGGDRLDPDPSDPGDEPSRGAGAGRRAGKGRLIVGAVASVLVLLAVAAGVVATQLEEPPRAKVPDVVNQDVAAATATLVADGFLVQTQPADGGTAARTVRAQDPASGTSVKKGAVITLMVTATKVIVLLPMSVRPR